MIGFIGMGIMGSRMAGNLQKAGYDLTVHNRTKEKAQDLLNKGAVWAASPAETAAKADIVFTMLANPDAVEASVFGDNGLLDGLSENSLWVDCSTVNPSYSKKLAKAAAEKGVRFLDAPVAGSKIPAENGELVFLVGGREEDLEEVRPMLEVMGKSVQYQGTHGSGISMKMLINLTLGQAMAAFSEAVTLGKAMGLDETKVVETLLNGATAAPFLQGKKDKILNDDYSAEFPLEHMQKDLHLVAQSAYENGVSLPVANMTKELYGLAKQTGKGELDFSAVYAFLSNKA